MSKTTTWTFIVISYILIVVIMTVMFKMFIFMQQVDEERFAVIKEKVYVQVDNIKEANEKLNQEIQTDELKMQMERIMSGFMNGKIYIIGKYDCSDFSRDLVKLLKNVGYNATCAYGFYRQMIDEDSYRKSPHTWVEVYKEKKTLLESHSKPDYVLEATSGEIVDMDEYENFYKRIGRGTCW